MSQAEETAKIDAQGTRIRELKAAKADKAVITTEARDNCLQISAPCSYTR